jgi:hypothetical protein
MNCFQVPVKLAIDPVVLGLPFFKFIDGCIDFVFSFDIILRFFISFPNYLGQEVKESPKIAKRYMLSWQFCTDILSFLGLFEVLEAFSVLKIVRVFRLSQFIKNLNVPREQKTLITLGKLILYLFIYIHFVGCVWYVTVSQRGIIPDGWEEIEPDENGRVISNGINKRMYQPWYPPLDWIDYTQSSFFTKDQTDLKKYTESLYYSILFMSGNELGPQAINEIFIAILIQLSGIFMNNKILGDLAMLVEQIIQSKSLHQQKFDSINEVMASILLPNNQQ